ncbi:MAG: L,D-transpeptidase [Pseudomonadota bacterium]
MSLMKHVSRSARRHLAPALLATLTIGVFPNAAQAQLFPWQWGNTWTNSWTQPAPAPKRSLNKTVLRVAFPRSYAPGQIIVSFRDRRLYHVTRRGEALSYPIAAPRKGDAWQGVMKVMKKRVNPRWTPTAEMRAENPKLPSYVPGGHPRNPLGSRALYLGSSLYRIHGTDAPWTIGLPVSRGCIRMHNAHVNHLYERVAVGATVKVTYRSLRPRRAYY